MKLKPVIASYSGESFHKIQQVLNDEALEMIAGIAQAPQARAEIPAGLLAELVDMHVLKEQEQLVRLNTAVFLRDDIENILNAVTPPAKEIAQLILENGSAFWSAPAEITIFLAGILGFVQGAGLRLSQKADIWEWKRYTGKYARSKVDFDEICEAYEVIGPDYLNKSVSQGERFTAVFIGPGGTNFFTITNAMNSSEGSQRYAGHLNRYLVDTYARLVSGEIQNEQLHAAAEIANLYKQGQSRSAVITNELIEGYVEAVHAIIEAVSACYDRTFQSLEALLRSTASGRHGVPPANMMMNLWRYIRKLTTKELYANGFFRDSIPEDGCLTVFYENNVELIKRLLL